MSVQTKIKRGLRPSVSKASESAPSPKGKQYTQTGPKYSGPNYPKDSVTGALQDGRSGGGRAK